ncbi:MAG TPA: class I SAM-dependent methyltransferase [Candidatus Saccharimonadales bacterium]|nr:class I SAM-dependent methyltransferase [Candidatus Saccharimonadales bacterium]
MSNDLVKEGYNKAADNYALHRDQFESIKYLKIFKELVDKGKTVLDIGCGAGRPVDEYLINQGFAVNGIDISKRMIELAKKNNPQALYEVKDMSLLKEGEYCVNGIVSFYAIFHTPREKHQDLFTKFASFMPNGGILLITMGASDWEGKEDFHGAEMFWSHYGSEKNKEMIEKTGFKIIVNEIDTSGGEKHQVIIAKI